MPPAEPHCYAKRLLNPFRGVAQIVETDRARAVSTDGINWRVQLRSEIYKTPWQELANSQQQEGYFMYGVWSRQDGLARIPVHPTLYQEHVEQAMQDLLFCLTDASHHIPFALADTTELWLMDAAGTIPIALLASALPGDTLATPDPLDWYASENAETHFTSTAFAQEQARSTIRSRTQDLLHRCLKRRCLQPYNALWVERLADGSGRILCNHKMHTQRRDEVIAPARFPDCLLNEDWQEQDIRQLVSDYLQWQAPLLLLLPLGMPRRRQLEHAAQQRPIAVYTYHHLYPALADQTLLNKILVEAVLRKAAASKS